MSTRTVLSPEERKKELLTWLQAIYDVSNPEYIEKNGLEGQPSLSELYKKVTGRPCGGPYHKAIMDLGVIRKLEKKRYKRKFEWSRNRATPNPWMATALYNRCNSRCSQYWNETGKERTEKKEKRNQELKVAAMKENNVKELGLLEFITEQGYEKSYSIITPLSQFMADYLDSCKEKDVYPISTNKITEKLQEIGIKVVRRDFGMAVYLKCKGQEEPTPEPIEKKHDLNLYGAYKDILEGVKRLEEKVGSLYYRNTPDHIRATVYDAMPGAILSAEQKLGVQLKLYSDRELVEELRERGYKIKFGRLVMKGSKRKFKL